MLFDRIPHRLHCCNGRMIDTGVVNKLCGSDCSNISCVISQTLICNNALPIILLAGCYICKSLPPNEVYTVPVKRKNAVTVK